MRTIRVYTSQSLVIGASLQLEDTAARHLAAVLRVKPGQRLALFNNTGGEYPAEVSACSGRKVAVVVTGFTDRDRESPLAISLGVGPSRGERMDWVVQKATELGAHSIAPLFTERTEVKLNPERAAKKRRHWQQVIVNACEQCGRNHLPEILPPQPVDRWLAEQTLGSRFILHHHAEQPFDPQSPEDSQISLLVGPEGGLTEDEVSSANRIGFQAVTLGPRVLRTETAPVAAISVLQMLWGDFS